MFIEDKSRHYAVENRHYSALLYYFNVNLFYFIYNKNEAFGDSITLLVMLF
jgi:hypothetical protein